MKKGLKKSLKITGIALGSLLGLVIVAGIVFYFVRKDDFDRLFRWKAWLDNALPVLRESSPYSTEIGPDTIRFQYQCTDDPELVRIREYFDLDTLIVEDEIRTIKNLMSFVHNSIRYDGSYYYEGDRNAIDLYEFHRETGHGINCRMMATTLNEIYLAAGFPSHFVTCMPADTLDTECHVITAVWSSTLGKWLWMDPSFETWVEDDAGHLLSIAEVRDRLIKGLPIQTSPGINFNGKPYAAEYYLQKYMAKNLYWFNMANESRYNQESLKEDTTSLDIALTPPGYSPWKRPWDKYDRQRATHNADVFWQVPE